LSGISPMPGISPADYSYVERGLRRFRSRLILQLYGVGSPCCRGASPLAPKRSSALQPGAPSAA
jgi:hypothetical protein